MPVKLLEEKLTAAHCVANDIAKERETLGIYVGGSIAVGLGSSSSDVDLVVVTPRPYELTVPEQRVCGRTRVDIEVRSAEQVGQLAREFGTYSASLEDQSQLYLPENRLHDAVRLKLAHVLHDSEFVSGARLRLPADELRRLLIARYSHVCVSLLEDLTGAGLDGDVATSALVSYEFLLCALQAYLAGCGDLYMGVKWSGRKLRRLSSVSGSLEPVVWRLLLVDSGAQPTEDLVGRRIRLGQALLAAAQLDGWSEPHAFEWTHWGYEAMGAFRSPEFIPGLYLGTGLMNSVRQIALSDEGVRLWGIADGKSRRETISTMAALVSQHSAGSADDAVGSVAKYLERLEERGLVVSREIHA